MCTLGGNIILNVCFGSVRLQTPYAIKHAEVRGGWALNLLIHNRAG